MRTLAEARLKRVRAVELLAAGHSYADIARELGYSHRGSAHRAVSQALTERAVEMVDQYRQLELDRLDRLHAALWPQAMSGDLGAIGATLRIIDQRVRLLGLQPGSTSERDNPAYLVVGPLEEGNPGEATPESTAP